jgi:hypothetical protein
MAAVVYPTAAAALARSAEIAAYLGCGQHPADVTEYWYSVDDVSLIVPDDDPDDNNHRLSQLVREDQLTEDETADVVEIYDAWATGVAYSIGDIVAFNDRAYSCRQAHTSQVDWSPSTAFTLWVVHRANEDELPWVACEPVEIGWTRTYDGTVYECIQAHVTQPDWTPDAVPALWASQAPPTSEWAVGVAYTIGDLVTYDGSTYECRQSHTSQAGWTPPVVPALWLLVS